MTYEEAKTILKTYKMPLTEKQAQEFREALKVVNANSMKAPSL
jgi:hypothetical protein